MFSTTRTTRREDTITERGVTVRDIRGAEKKCQPRKLRRDRRDLGSFSITVHPRARYERENTLYMSRVSRARIAWTRRQQGETTRAAGAILPHLTRLVIAFLLNGSRGHPADDIYRVRVPPFSISFSRPASASPSRPVIKFLGRNGKRVTVPSIALGSGRRVARPCNYSSYLSLARRRSHLGRMKTVSAFFNRG